MRFLCIYYQLFESKVEDWKEKVSIELCFVTLDTLLTV